MRMMNILYSEFQWKQKYLRPYDHIALLIIFNLLYKIAMISNNKANNIIIAKKKN